MSLYRGTAGIEDLERLAGGDSPVHRLHPGAKITVTLVYAAALISVPPRNLSSLMAYLLYPAVLMPLSGTPWGVLLARLTVALPFAFFGALSSLIFLRDPAFRLGAFIVSAGMVSFVSILLKTVLSVLAVLILIATTPFTEISRGLTRMGLPRIAALQFVMTYRYISVLIREAASMFTAYTLRSPDSRGIRMGDMGAFLGQLLLRSIDRAERVYGAMQCRGFDGEYRSGPARPFDPADFAYAALLCLGIAALRFFNLSLFFGRLLGAAG